MHNLHLGYARASHLEGSIVEPVLRDQPIFYKNVVCQDRWFLVTGSVILKYGSFCRTFMVCQDRWSLIAVVHCN